MSVDDSVRSILFMTNMQQLTRVSPNLFVSDWDAAHDATLLKAHSIRVVLNMCPGEQSEDDVKMYTDLGIHVQQFPLTEEEYPREERLTEQQTLYCWHTAHMVISEAHAQNQAVLVHCVVGVNRSVATIIYHLIRTSSPNYARAHWRIRSIRPQISVDDTFVTILEREARQLRKKNMQVWFGICVFVMICTMLLL